jgi:hypothetical protein
MRSSAIRRDSGSSHEDAAETRYDRRLLVQAESMNGIMFRFRASVLALLLLQAACASSIPWRVSDTLYFGTQKPGGVVSEADWNAFLADVVTPRFPEGLTVWDAHGQWKSSSGEIVRESSRVVQLIHDDTSGADQAIAEIVREYERRFQQESVMRVRARVRVAF